MQKISWLVCASLLSLFSSAQVIAPAEIQQPLERRLQTQYLGDLRAIGTEISLHKFPYPFYFSRVLDLDQDDQLRADQRSIRFAKFNGQIVLEITGNEAVRQAVKAGAGIAVISRRAIQDDVRCGLLAALGFQGSRMVRDFFLVTHRTRSRSPLGNAFAAFIRASAASA